MPQAFHCYILEVYCDDGNLRAEDYSICWDPAVGLLFSSVWD